MVPAAILKCPTIQKVTDQILYAALGWNKQQLGSLQICSGKPLCSKRRVRH